MALVLRSVLVEQRTPARLLRPVRERVLFLTVRARPVATVIERARFPASALQPHVDPHQELARRLHVLEGVPHEHSQTHQIVGLVGHALG